MFAMMVSLTNINAQTVIQNSYDSNKAEVKKDPNVSESFGTVSFQYLSFDGFENYGLAISQNNPNKWGWDMNLRAQFESHGNYNIDWLANYSVELSKSESFGCYLTLAAGPSLRLQDEAEINSKGELKWENGFFIDAVLNPRLTLKVNGLAASIGYFYWAPKFKFSKDDGAVGGLSLSIGLAF